MNSRPPLSGWAALFPARRGCISALLLCTTMLASAYTPLVPIAHPRIVTNAIPYPGDHYFATNLIDGDPKTEYSSDGKGTNTFVVFDFGAPVPLAAFRHIDRNDPATIAASELTLYDAAGQTVATIPVKHSAQRAGETFYVLPAPVTAQRVKWRVTECQLGTVGGAEISFFKADKAEAAPSRDLLELKAVPFLERDGENGLQTIQATIRHLYAEPADVILRAGGSQPKSIQLKPGVNTVEWKINSTKAEKSVTVSLEHSGKRIVHATFTQKPPRPLTVYILPHSHTDIGYTEIQSAIEKKQVQNLVDGMAAAKRTATYPEGARFVWNVEVLWAADLYLRRMNDAQRAEFMEAVKQGQVALNGMYLNELTGLCRPEELIQLFRFGTKLSEQTGVPIESAMISDVPGYTWGTVSAMSQAGIKYFSAAPNYFDRIGTILREWENKPFYWAAPDGKSKVLVWIPFWGYAMSHRYGKMSPNLVADFYDGLEKRAYPYEIAYVRWSGHGDNAVPDPAICDFVRDWNAKYVWPKFVISGTTEAFRAMEKRYGAKLPIVRGDWTPYWEDGAGSSAIETSLNRESSDRLAQAETLFAMQPSGGAPGVAQPYPPGAFADAWRDVLLYSEHTWGAWCSVTGPDRKETKEQWEVKKSYADQAAQQSRDLLQQALHVSSIGADHAVDVLNTLSWSRTELVLVPADLSSAGDRVTDDRGAPVPSQRLASGELAFIAREVPPFASQRYSIGAGSAGVGARATAAGSTLDNGIVRLRVDEKTGGVTELAAKGFDGNFVDTSGGESLNDYLYLIGDDLKNLKRNDSVKISVGEKGPLVASLIIESEAPGCKSLRRELRMVAGLDYVEAINVVDKARLAVKSYMAKDGKESVNFGFPFNVPDGDVTLDIPLGLMRVEKDQMPSACKNWLTVGRWADVANRNRGVTLVTLDAPLMQVGGLTAILLNSQTNPDVWRKKINRSQKLYSWAMNNHWGTNYRACQEGPTRFRYILRPHGMRDAAANTRFATGFSQPLLARRAGKDLPLKSLLRLSSDDVVVTALKPSDDGRAWIVRLFGASNEAKSVKLAWGDRQPRNLFLSDTSEKPCCRLDSAIDVPAHGVVTVRAELE